jgi:anti-sigma factor RsiW
MIRNVPLCEETIAAYLDNELSPKDRAAFEAVLNEHPEWRVMVAEQGRVIGALRPLKIKPPKADVWDHYWEEIDQRIRGVRMTSQLFMLAGGTVLLLTGTVLLVAHMTNPWLRLGTVLFAVGFLMMFGVVLAGRRREMPKDRYRRIRK